MGRFYPYFDNANNLNKESTNFNKIGFCFLSTKQKIKTRFFY